MKVEISMLHMVRRYFDLEARCGFNMVSASINTILNNETMMQAGEKGKTLLLYEKKPLRSDLRLYNLGPIRRILKDVISNEIDVQSFVKYERNEKLIYLDLSKLYPVYNRLEFLGNWHAISRILPVEGKPEYTRESLTQLINDGLEKLSHLPGGVNFAYLWHQQHLQYGYRLPLHIKPTYSLNKPKDITHFRKLNRRLWVSKNSRKNKRR